MPSPVGISASLPQRISDTPALDGTNPNPLPVRESLHPLATLAMREAGAEGYAFFRREAGWLLPLGGSGLAIPPENVTDSPDPALVVYPLRSGNQITGFLAFRFRGLAVTPAAKSRVCRMAASIQQVWQLSEASLSLAGLAARLGELEAELADSKIASRTRGFLENPDGSSDLVETVSRHVQTVLKRFESSEILEKRRGELEAELEERTRIGQAKALLQVRAGLSEEAAHLHLRLLSRKTRRPIREIAIEVIEQPPALSGAS